MRAGTFRDLRKGQLKDAAPLRSFLPLALLRGPALSDDQVVFVGECLAGRYQKTRPMGSCRYCQQPMLPRHHLVCKGINGLHVARHEKIMAALLAAARGRTARIARNPAVPVDHLQPDFVIGDLVVAVPWRLERSYVLKMGKYRPLEPHPASPGHPAHVPGRTHKLLSSERSDAPSPLSETPGRATSTHSRGLTRALFQPSMASSSLRSAYLPVGPPCYLT